MPLLLQALALQEFTVEPPSLSRFVNQVVRFAAVSVSMRSSIQQLLEDDAVPSSSSLVAQSFPGNGVMWKKKKARRNPFSQVVAMGHRLRLQYGSNIFDIVVLPIAFAIMAYILNFDGHSPKNTTIGCMMLFFIPIIIVQNHVLLGTKIWVDHGFELDDGRVFLASYQVASLLYCLSIAVLSTLVSLAIAYAILEWDWASFPNQLVFGCVYLLLIIGFGRCLSLVFNGDYIFFRVYLLVIFLNICLAGYLSTPGQAPESVRWLFSLSFTFWAFAGVLTNQFEHNKDIGGENPCQSFATCVMYNGDFLAAYSGFWPFGNTRLALNVLTGIYLVFVVAEYWLLRLRRAHA